MRRNWREEGDFELGDGVVGAIGNMVVVGGGSEWRFGMGLSEVLLVVLDVSSRNISSCISCMKGASRGSVVSMVAYT